MPRPGPLSSIVSTAIAAASAVGGPPALTASANPRETDRSAAPAWALLTRPIERIEWVDEPLEEIVEWLEDLGEGRVNVITRWNQLGPQGLDRDTLVNLKLVDTNVAEILNEVIENLRGSGLMTYQAEGNKLRLSTPTDFDRNLITRVYDAADLLHRIPDMGGSAPSIDLQSAAGGGSTGGGGSTPVFQSSSGGSGEESGQQAEQNTQTRLQTLALTMARAMGPNAFGTVLGAPFGTGPGTLLLHDRSLIVVATAEVHEQIGGMLLTGR